jgi:hypothetical protein
MRRLATALVLCAVACSSTPPKMNAQPNGVIAMPMQLAFLCVTPGCEETETVEIDIQGNRRVAIKRVLLGGSGSTDFTIAPSEMPPFIVGAGSDFTVDVTYTPMGAPAPGEAKLLITYTDASPDESPDRLPPGQLEIPLVRRIVGEPLLTVSPAALQFGVVDAGNTATQPVHVSNEGFGNIVLQIAGVDAGAHSPFGALLPSDGGAAMPPDAGFDMAILFRPTTEAYFNSTVTVLPTDPSVAPGYLAVEGTSLSYPKLALQPAGDLDFGLLPKGHQRSIDRQLMNQGGRQLSVTSIDVADSLNVLKLTMPLPDAGTVVLDPLERLPLKLLIDGATAGDVAATVTFSSNDPTTPMFVMKVTGTVTDPDVQLTPATVDFGIPQPDGGSGLVPVGWVVTRPVEIKNVGYGPLTVKNITMVGTSAHEYTLKDLPALPLTLDRDARAAFNVQFQADVMAQLTFPGQVSVETDAHSTDAFAVVTLSAAVGTCADSCPIANGTASCDTGSCQIGMCTAGFYDTDMSPADGCECREVSATDPGQFCMGAARLGSLDDEAGQSTTFHGIIPTGDDIDLVEFYGNDSTGFFTDSYDVKVRLDSADPGIAMCVYHNSGNQPPAGTCYFSEEVCPASRYYEKGGSWGGDDSADYVVKVYRTAQSTPTCTPYTVFMSNGL